MVSWILAALIVIPIVEIAVLIKVGGLLGVWPTVALVVATAMAGTVLLRLQGLATLFRVQASLREGRFPIAEVFDGMCLLVAGALLLTPGFVTDLLGLLLFVPALRVMLREFLARRLIAAGKVRVHTAGPEPGPGTPPGSPPVIEGDYEDVTPDRRR